MWKEYEMYKFFIITYEKFTNKHPVFSRSVLKVKVTSRVNENRKYCGA